MMSRLQLVALAAAAAAGMLAACGEPAPHTTPRTDLPPASDEPFLDVTEAAGLDFVHRVGDGFMDNIIESVGSGAVWFDADGDGDLDVYLVNQRWLEGVSTPPRPSERPRNQLYLNRGNGTFADATPESGVGDEGYGYAAAAADFDNDGDQDLYVANCGANRLFRNRGDGRFDDVTEAAGVGDARCSAASTFLDADGDGLLDLYVANYLEFDPGYRIHYAPDVYPGPLAYQAQPDALYRNLGDGRFEDVTRAAGLEVPAGRAMGVVATDFDADGDPDVFVANDASENFLFRNDGAGHFEEVGVSAGVAYGFYGEATGAMAGSIGDVDEDGRPDILVTDISYGSLYRNTGHGVFEDWVVRSGLAAPSGQWVSWGGGFFDFDNDGDVDVLQVNGDLKHPTGRPDLLLANLGGGSFDVAWGGSYFATERIGRGGCFADFDEDGDLDILVTNLNDRPVLLRNDAPTGPHWLRLELVGTRGNRDALGARVTLRAGDRRRVQIRSAPTGYLTQSDPRLHFGLGATSRVESVEVVWPGGARERFEGLVVDRLHRLVEGEGEGMEAE